MAENGVGQQIDVAVLGDKVAPKIYTFKIAPRVVLARPTL